MLEKVNQSGCTAVGRQVDRLNQGATPAQRTRLPCSQDVVRGDGADDRANDHPTPLLAEAGMKAGMAGYQTQC